MPVVKSVMEDAPHPAVSLPVPLQVEARAAANWDEAHYEHPADPPRKRELKAKSTNQNFQLWVCGLLRGACSISGFITA